MDTTATTPVTDTIVAFDEAVVVEDPSNISFGKEIAKTFAVSAATSVAAVGGLIAVGYAVGKFQEFKTRRASKKADTVVEGEVVGNVTETPLQD